jgi:hypothetical protein
MCENSVFQRLFSQSVLEPSEHVGVWKNIKRQVQKQCIQWNYDDTFTDWKLSEEEGKELEQNRELFTILPCPRSLKNFEKLLKTVTIPYLASVLIDIIYCYVYTLMYMYIIVILQCVTKSLF